MKFYFFLVFILFTFFWSVALDYGDWNSGDQDSKKKALEKTIEQKRKPIKKLEENKSDNKTKIKALQKLREEMKLLDKKAKLLYGVDSVFKGMEVASSDEKILKATYKKNEKIKPLKNYQFKVKQLAKGQKIISGEINGNIKLPQSVTQLKVGKENLKFSFQGGGIYDFIEEFNKQFDNFRIAVVNKKKKKILILTSSITGAENNLQLIRDNSGLFSRLKLFKSENPAALINIKKTKQQYPYYFNRKSITLFPNEKISLAITGACLFTKENQLSFFFKSEKDEFLKKQFRFSQLINDKKNSKNFFAIHNIDIFPNIPIVEENQKIGFMEIKIDGKEKNVDFRISTNQANKVFIYFLEDFGDLNSEQKIEVSKIVFFNHSKTKKYTFAIPGFLPRERKYVPVKTLVEPQDSIVEYEGIEFNNPSNKVVDLIDGMTLELNQTNDKPVNLKVDNNSVKVKNVVIDYINSYNDFIHFLNILIARGDMPDNIRKEDEKYYGLLTGERELRSIRNKFWNLLTKKYREDKQTKNGFLFAIGIGSYYNKNEFLNTAKIDFKETEFDSALQEIDFESFKELFAIFSKDKKNYISGYAFEINKLVREYTRGSKRNNKFSQSYIALRISSLQKRNKDIDKDIAEEEEKIEDFRQRTLKEFSKIDGAQEDLKRAQQQLQSIGR